MKTLANFRDIHKGAQIVVCGLGESLSSMATMPSRLLTIGVNDIGRLFDPTYLVVVNRKDQFTPERWKWIETSWSEYVFTCFHDLGHRQDIIHFKLGDGSGATILSGNDSLPYTRNSPYVALCLAAFMGAAPIGLIGVDFTDHHLANTARKLARIDAEYKALGDALKEKGIEIVNLSAVSRLTAFPKISVEEFLK